MTPIYNSLFPPMFSSTASLQLRRKSFCRPPSFGRFSPRHFWCNGEGTSHVLGIHMSDGRPSSAISRGQRWALQGVARRCNIVEFQNSHYVATVLPGYGNASVKFASLVRIAIFVSFARFAYACQGTAKSHCLAMRCKVFQDL
jgi:hypothetical protein